jgi:hypothetical protein
MTIDIKPPAGELTTPTGFLGHDASNPGTMTPAQALALLGVLTAPTFTGLTTVAGVKVASGAASGTLTMAGHSGGVFTTSGNCTCPNEAGFSITLLAGGAHTVQVASGTPLSLAAGDMLSIVIPAAGTVRAVHPLAADVITMTVS